MSSGHGGQAYPRPLGAPSTFPRPPIVVGGPSPFMQPVSAALGWLSEEAKAEQEQLEKERAAAAARNANTNGGGGGGGSNHAHGGGSSGSGGGGNVKRDESKKYTPPPDAQGFAAEYTVGRQLGEGAFAVVKECHNVEGERFAVKVVRKSPEEVKNAMIRREIALMKELRHSPKIVRLYDVFEEPSTFHLVLEFEEGGDLFDRLVERERLSEKIARDVFRDVVMALTVCHEQFIVHRDLKPENLLLSTVDKGTNHEFSEVKLADFGMAMRTTEEDDSLSGFCGTPFYMAPEVIKGDKYGRPVDCWSLGTILYTILTGWPPFYHNNDKVLYTLIKENRPDFDNKQWSMVSAEAKDLCQRLIVSDPAKRYTIDQVASHPWVALIDAPDVNLHHAIHHLKSFNARRKFRAAAWAVMVPSRLQAALKALKSAAAGESDTVQPGPMALHKLNNAFIKYRDQLTHAQLQQILTDLGFRDSAQWTHVANMLDPEGTGMADKRELLCMLGMIMGGGEEDAMRFCFKALDVDNSQELSRDELVKLLNFVEFGQSGDVSQELSSLFEHMDTNGDGLISFTEFRNAIMADPTLAAAWKGGTTVQPIGSSPKSQSKFHNRRSALKGMERTFSGKLNVVGTQ